MTLILLEPHYSDFFDALPRSQKAGSARRPGASAPSKVRFHDEVKFKTIKAREGKGLALSITQLLDNVLDDDDDEDSFEVESEEDSEDDQQGDTQGQLVNEDSDAELSSDDEGSHSDDDRSPEDRFAFSNGHQTIKRLQDDLLADEDEPDNGTHYFSRILDTLMPGYQVCPHMRGVSPSFNNKLQTWRPKILPKKTGL